MLAKIDARGSPSFSSSVTSLLIDSVEIAPNVKNNIKEWLKSRIFLGRYTERRLVNANIGYRDIVLLSPAETNLKRDLIEASYQLRSVCNNQWIGITESESLGYKPNGICLWTEIENQPFGAFWFQIKSVKFREQEVIILLKCLRHITDAFLEIEPILTGKKKVKETANEVKSATDSAAALNETYIEIVNTVRTAVSIRNMKEFVTFLIAFVIAIFTGSTAFVNFLGNFVLALIRELSLLVKNSTPMFLGVLDFFSKIVGGFYILLAMFFKPSPQVPISKRSIPFDRHRSGHSSRYDESQHEFDPRNFD